MTTPTPQFSENASYEMDFDQPAINIGSHPGNDIVLQGNGVRPFHVSIILQDGECQILLLESGAEVRLDGKVVQSAQFKLSGAARQLNVGENILFLQHNKTFDSLHVRINPARNISKNEATPKDTIQPTSPVSILPVGESAILLNLLSQAGEVEVGQTASYELDVVNAGPLVASFNIFVEGVPKEWVSISPEEINLNEGQHKRVHINIIPPRQPSSTAGQHELRVSVFSANYPDDQAVVSIMLSIKPYYEFTVGNLSPREQSMRWPKKLADTSLSITNLGNCPADFAVSALDDENGCSFDFVMDDGLRLSRQATLSDVAAGEMLSLPIEVSPHKRPFFALSNRRYSYTTTVQVTNHPIAPQQVSGFLTSRPLVGRWSVILTVLLLIIVAFFVVQPNIYDFQVAAKKDIIELGDSTKLLWSVSPFASRVTISNTDQLLNNGQTSLTITPKQSTTYELVSGNWLSGLLNMDRRESRTVLVVPPSPTINVFAVDNTRVAEGKPVHIRWSVTQADQAFLTIDNVVTELPKEKFSGEQDVVLGKDSLVTLDAKNTTGGDALRSYFVNVEKPNINVVTFTVWVATEKTGLPIKNRVAKLDALSQASPDPNFPEKYVELIPDNASDNGYRANFYQPERQLAKGEQVLVEWNVSGVDNDKVKIAPFTDELPSKGSQAYFPKESMNFVLTAKSGTLEKIFMLPVKVFDGTPPTAPKIEFFQGVPVSMVGAGDVQFSWSVTGAWTRIQLMTGDKIIADYLNAQGAKTVRVSQSATYILVAWNGTLSSAKPLDITVNPNLIPVTLQITSIYPDSDQFLVGNKITVSIKISSTDPAAKGKPSPSGTITVTDGVSTCSITLPAVSCELTFKSAGDKKLWASYSGDTIYSQGTSAKYPPDKKIHVTSPTVKLTPNFYLTDGKGNKIGSAMDDITSHQFRMNEELYISINVTPISAILPVDQKGHITLTICNQNDSNDCSDAIAAVVNVQSDGSYGTATILITNFPGAGLYSLRFDYRHDDNLLAPASHTQKNVQVLKLGIYLTLPPSCATSIDDGAICSFSADPNDAHVIFDIHQTIGLDYLDTSMPAPKLILDKKTIWNVKDVVKQKSLDCEIDTKNRTNNTGSSYSVYVLDCPIDVVGRARISVNYTYNNSIAPDYFMGVKADNDFARQPFFLQPAGETYIEFTRSNYSVGQIIYLNKDLHLMNSDTQSRITKATGKMIFSSTKQPKQLGLLGTVPGSSCYPSADGDKILNIDVDDVCQIFFRKAGTWDIQIDFLGDANYASSSASVAGLQVDQQAIITSSWSYSGNSWDGIAKVDQSLNLTGKIIFDGSFGTGSNKVFSNKVFDGVPLVLDPGDYGGSKCSLNEPSSHKITYQTASQQAVYNFVVTCEKSPSKVTLTLDVDNADPEKEQSNFGSILSTRQVLFASATNIGGVYFELALDQIDQKGYFNFNWQSKSPSPKTIPLLYAGETYKLHLMYQPELILNSSIKTGGCSGLCNTLPDVLDYLQYTDKSSMIYRKIKVTFPDSWKGHITSVGGGCSFDGKNNTIIVPLSGPPRSNLLNSWPGWSYAELSSPALFNLTDYTDYSFDDTADPCTVSFGFTGEPDSNLPIGAGKVTGFGFYNETSFNEPTTGLAYSADENYVVAGLTKVLLIPNFNPPALPNQPLKLFNTTVQAGSPAQTVTMTLTNLITTKVPLTTTRLEDWFDVTYPTSCMGLTGTIDLASNTVTWIMTPPSISQYPCPAGTLDIYYKETDYFRRELLVSQPVQFAKPAPSPTPTP